MLFHRFTRQSTLYALAYTSSNFDEWRRRIDEARHLMYRKGQSSACTTRFFMQRSNTYNPTKTLSANIGALCLKSKILIATLFGTPFACPKTGESAKIDESADPTSNTDLLPPKLELKEKGKSRDVQSEIHISVREHREDLAACDNGWVRQYFRLESNRRAAEQQLLEEIRILTVKLDLSELVAADIASCLKKQVYENETLKEELAKKAAGPYVEIKNEFAVVGSIVAASKILELKDRSIVTSTELSLQEEMGIFNHDIGSDFQVGASENDTENENVAQSKDDTQNRGECSRLPREINVENPENDLAISQIEKATAVMGTAMDTVSEKLDAIKEADFDKSKNLSQEKEHETAQLVSVDGPAALNISLTQSSNINLNQSILSFGLLPPDTPSKESTASTLSTSVSIEFSSTASPLQFSASPLYSPKGSTSGSLSPSNSLRDSLKDQKESKSPFDGNSDDEAEKESKLPLLALCSLRKKQSDLRNKENISNTPVASSKKLENCNKPTVENHEVTCQPQPRSGVPKSSRKARRALPRQLRRAQREPSPKQLKEEEVEKKSQESKSSVGKKAVSADLKHKTQPSPAVASSAPNTAIERPIAPTPTSNFAWVDPKTLTQHQQTLKWREERKRAKNLKNARGSVSIKTEDQE